MTIENGVRVVAGTMVLISVALVVFVSKWWLLLTCFVGVNLIQSAFTGFCPPGMLLAKMGLKSCVPVEEKPAEQKQEEPPKE